MSLQEVEIELNGITEILQFDTTEDCEMFETYRKECEAFLLDLNNMTLFQRRARSVMAVKLPRPQLIKWRLFFIRKIEQTYLEEKEKRVGFIPKTPIIKEGKGTLDEICKKLNPEDGYTNVVIAIYNMAKEDVFAEESLLELKPFLTYFCMRLFGLDKKKDLYEAYQQLKTNGFIKKFGVMNEAN